MSSSLPAPEQRKAPAPSADALLELIDALVRELQPGNRLPAGLDSALDRDLGLDSLARVELLARVERRFAVRLAAETLGTCETPRQLLGAVAQAACAPLPPPAAPGAPLPPPAPARGEPDAAATLLQVLGWHAGRHPERVHVTFYDRDERIETLTYGELADAAEHTAGALFALGLHAGDRVALMLPSGLDFFRAFFGILSAGMVPVPIYPPARPSQLEDHLQRQAGILRNCEARALITFERVRPLARMLAGLAPALAHVATPAGLAAAPALRPLPASADELALIQYTSGSTGEPKGVMLTHANLLSNIRAWGTVAALDSNDVCVSWLPLYHDMGLIGTWMGSLYYACPLVLMSPLDFLAHPERWLWAIHHHRGTVTAAPNFAFELCVKRLADADLDGLDLSCWRLAANGAEPVNPDTLQRFAATFAPYGLPATTVTPVYGLAECAVGLCVSPPGRGAVIDRVERSALHLGGDAVRAAADDGEALRFVCCGAPLPGHEVRIVDGAGHVLPERRVGHLEFRGPSATAGYYRNPAASAALFDDGWLVTGDHAYLADGELYVTGRAKEVIIRAGRNLYPYDLEQAIGALPGVRKGCVAVFGAGTDGGEERLIVIAETAVDDAGARHRLQRQIVAAALAEFDLAPDAVILAPPHTVLKTSSGKIRRAALREAYLRGGLDTPPRPPWLQLLRLQRASARARLRRHLQAVPAVMRAAWMWAMFAALAPLAVAAILLLPRLDQRWTAIHRLARLCQRLCGCPLRVEGLRHLPAAPCILVANHASYIDGLVLVAALPQPVRFVAKAELAGNRVLGPLFARMDTCFVNRADSRQSVEDSRRLGALASAGAPLLFFAEGTFTAQEGLRAFRLGAFQSAIEQALAVVPVALAGTRRVLRDGSWRPQPGALAVTVCPPLAPAGEDWHALLALRDATRTSILARCGETDAAAPR